MNAVIMWSIYLSTWVSCGCVMEHDTNMAFFHGLGVLESAGSAIRSYTICSDRFQSSFGSFHHYEQRARSPICAL